MRPLPPPRMTRRTATPGPDSKADPAAAPEEAAGLPGQPDPEEKGPLRRCVVTRESLPKETMIRFVLGPDRVLVPDLAGRMPGRGMWLSARGDVLERALTRGAFMKAARGPVHPIPDLRTAIVDGLRRRIRDQVGLARRAGQAVVGFQQAREWLQAGRAALLVEAADGSASERSRLVGSHGVPVVTALEAAELGAVFGRDHAVHVAVASGRLAEGILREAARLAGLLQTGPGEEDARGGERSRGRNRKGSGTGAPASPYGAKAARPSGAGHAGRPDEGGHDGASRGDSSRAGRGPASGKGGRQGARPRREGEPAVPVTQER
ncbi:RNA-binding protein [Roseomonas xinghualingensis]|uniref:RNA-binding protein n=1 Tax=Roseomonas xinghualingensis TaxID=2986475 RepID=UPI0021F10E56|nr:RNA-binding protein [Roseomonas sp. SXEYE001]MCV4206099.1 RNA-binding protein [Roseomonas sp. SXEYE001]